jgi:hypothetical protein
MTYINSFLTGLGIELSDQNKEIIHGDILKALKEDIESLPEKVVHRDAETGQFVTEEEAKNNPETTVSQTIKSIP